MEGEPGGVSSEEEARRKGLLERLFSNPFRKKDREARRGRGKPIEFTGRDAAAVERARSAAATREANKGKPKVGGTGYEPGQIVTKGARPPAPEELSD